jgi:hypothetical protein
VPGEQARAVNDANDPGEAADVERLGQAIAALDDDSLRHAVATMSEQSRNDLAGTLQLPRATMHLGNALPPLLRRKLHAAPPPRQLTAAFALTEAANDETVQALGARHDDPSRDDLLEVLPAIVEQHGGGVVTLMMAAYAASDAQCQAVMADLLTTDERFAVGDPVDDTTADAATPGPRSTTSGPADDDPEREARREERKAAKAARRDAQQRQRAAQQNAQAARKAAQRRAKHH